VQPDVADMVALPNDLLLLASDGLTKHVKDERLREIVENAPSLEAACEQLVKAAKDDGGDDNITCLLIRMADQPWYKKFLHGAAQTQSQNSL